MKLFIFAHRYDNAKRLAFQLNLLLGGWTYVYERKDVFRGHADSTLLIAPGSHLRRDLGEVIAEAERREFNILYVDEPQAHHPKPSVPDATGGWVDPPRFR